MKTVLIPTKLDPVAREILEQHGGYTVIQDESRDVSALAAEYKEAAVLIVRSEKITPEIMDALPSLRLIVRAGAGYNTIDVKYARKKGIDVMNTPGANANAVAEEVVAMMLADARNIVPADPSVRSGKWEKKKFMGREISGKTVGILGLGYIGRHVARRLSGFDVTLLGYDPVLSEDRARELGVDLVSVPDLFARCEYVTLHVPENDETRGMVDEALLRSMPEGATLVNCARAGIVDEDALRKVKAERSLRYLNDVYPKDEAGEKTVADVADLMLPHLGASTVEANRNAARRAAQQVIEFDEKGITTYIVNRDIPAGLDEAYADLAYTLSRLCRTLVGRSRKLRTIETSCYGSLEPFGDWLLVPILAALSEEFDTSMDFRAAREYLKDMGIDYENRETDSHKGFENSITIDMTAGDDAETIRCMSIRGTVAESTLMVSRINDFDKLYFEPKGWTAFFSYRDRPGVLARIGSAVAEAGVNIDDVRNPHDSKGEKSIAIVKINRELPADVVRDIAGDIDADIACCLEL